MHPPKLAPLHQKQLWILLETYTLVINEHNIIIPVGFEFDAASVPRLFWRIITPADPRIIGPAMIHDYLYTTGALPRDVCDLIFRDLLIENTVPTWLANTMYRAVRLGGGRAYARMS